MRLKARAISPGSGGGTALVSPAPFSFGGGADPATGAVLDGATGCRGGRLAGRQALLEAGPRPAMRHHQFIGERCAFTSAAQPARGPTKWPRDQQFVARARTTAQHRAAARALPDDGHGDAHEPDGEGFHLHLPLSG